MGQDIKYIITTQELNVPINLIHFKERNTTVFPILMDDSTFEYISVDSKESSDNVSEFFKMILCGGYNLEYPAKRLFTFIQISGLKTLAIIGYREFLDTYQNIGIPILFLNDKIVDLTQNEISEEKIHQSINAEIAFREIISNEEKYWCYESAEMFYLENLKNGH